MKYVLFALLGCVLLTSAAQAGVADTPHPFLLWTRADLAALRRKVENEPWARKAYEDMMASPERHGDEMRDLFAYAVMGDAAAGERQKKLLLSLLKAPHPLGGALEFRILAYDLLHDALSVEERKAVQDLFRAYIPYSIKPGGAYDSELFNNTKKPPYSRYDGEDGKYTRTNWLPNIIFPRKISANLMAAALRDEKLIRECWAVHGSLKYYLDDYLTDWGFYTEEFSKQTATPGALFLYCMAARNLGLDELGFGYKGARGATFRGHIQTVVDLTYPRVDLGGARPRYPRVTLGDVRGYGPIQHATVDGFFPIATRIGAAGGAAGDSPVAVGGNRLWNPAGAWGGTTRGKSDQWDNDKTEKMTHRLWFEFSHKLWPEAGFDYFLAQMRDPGQEKYIPTLFFGLDPIDPARVKAPPAKSWIAPARGLAMLRAEESPAHWESPAPVATLRLPSPYAHHVNDPLVLAGFYAHGRPLYVNHQPNPGYAFKFSRSIRSHCGVMVDGHVPAREGGETWGQTGSYEPVLTTDFTTRHDFTPPAKFAAVRTAASYPGIDQTRALVLTSQYLLDVFDNRDPTGKEHAYAWIIHAVGRADADQPAGWAPSKDLADLIKDLTQERSLDTAGKDWSVTVTQAPLDGQPVESPLARAWFERKVGTRIHLLGQSGVKGYLTRSPERYGQDGQPTVGSQIVPLSTLVATRTGPAAAFVALHEPFDKEPALTAFRRIAQTDAALAVAVEGRPGSGVNDRILLRLGDGHDQDTTLSAEAGGGAGDAAGESFTFADWGFVRIGAEAVEVRGQVKTLKVRVTGTPKLTVNGADARATLAQGLLTWKRD